MKAFYTSILVLLASTAYGQSNLPACQGRDISKWSIKTYLIPFFGSYNINRIAQQQINEFHQWRSAKLGRELSKNAQANHNAAMNLVLDFARGLNSVDLTGCWSV